MAHYNQPGRLETLSKVAVAEYLPLLCIRLVKLIEADGDTVDSDKVIYAEQVVSRVQQRLHNAIPCVLANDIASEMLKHVDYCYKHIRDSFSQPWCKKILSDMVKAILHPDLTVIDLTWEWTYISQFVFHHMPYLNKLEVLKLDKRHVSAMTEEIKGGEHNWIESFIERSSMLSNLNVLGICFYCTDNILKTIASCCNKLRNLDVSSSKNVTDESIEYISKMSALEELNLSGTSVSKSGYMRLILQCSESSTKECYFNSHALKSFGCDCYTTSQLNAIVSEFKNLVEINIVVRNCDVAVLGKLSTLQKLSMKWGGFSAVKQLLLVIGDQILELRLDLDFSDSVDLKFVAEKCPNLQSLSVAGDTCATNVADEKLFPSITHLTLETRHSSSVEYLLSRCHNLQVLELCTVREFFDTVIPRVLFKNPFNCLEQLIMGSTNETLHKNTIDLMSTHCKNLTVFKIFGYPTVETKKLCDTCPGLRRKCDSRWELPTFEITHSPAAMTRFRKFVLNY